MSKRLVCLLFGHRFAWDPAQSWVNYLDQGISCTRCGYAPGLPTARLPPHATDEAERAADAALAENQEPR